jgi:alkylation response protein AidB-like acyl-CoA dehydrogenase
LNLELDDDQREILAAVESLLERHAGPARAIELARTADYDHALDAALAEAGFDEAMDPETHEGALEATLIVEAVSRAAGVTGLAASALVAPAVCGRKLTGPVALGTGSASDPMRFAAQARTLLWLAGDEVRLVSLEPGEAEPIDSNFGYPLGRLAP